MGKMSMLLAVLLVIICSCGQQSGDVQVKPATTENEPAKGLTLFQQNCASCHAMKIDLVGPALAGVTTRWTDKQKLYSFIRNAPEVVKQDKYAKELFEKYNGTAMTSFPNLTDADIDAILSYIESQGK
jgi:mono/diheme cytochrome c family protein